VTETTPSVENNSNSNSNSSVVDQPTDKNMPVPNPFYEYSWMLERLYGMTQPTAERMPIKLKPPSIGREGRKSYWMNFAATCQALRRDPEHVMAFVIAETASTASIDGSHSLVIRGAFKPTQIETIVRSYVAEYVQCKTCKKTDTNLTRNNRLLFVVCESCGTSRSVPIIKGGFRAPVGKRRNQTPGH